MSSEQQRKQSAASQAAWAAQFSFLGEIPPDEIAELFAGSADNRKIPLGRVLFEQDQPITYIYVITEGKFWQGRTEIQPNGTQRSTLVREIGPGAILGALDFLFGNTYRTKARADEDSAVLAISTTALNRLIVRHPEVRERLAPLKLIDRLRTIPLVGRLEEVGLGFLADAAQEKASANGEQLYAAGQLEENVYLVDRGQVRLEADNGQDHWLGNGAVFGLADPADATKGARRMNHKATTTAQAKLIVLPHARFTDIAGRRPDSAGWTEINVRESVIEQLLVFSKFKREYDRHMAGFVSHYYLPYSHVIIQQGEEADSLWVLMPNSRAAIHANDAQGNKLITTTSIGPTYFAETALLGLVPQDSTIEAEAGSEWLRLHWRDFERLANLENDNLRADLVVDPARQQVVVDREQRKKYEWLQPGELLIQLSRRHWIAYLRKGIPAFIIFVILLAVTIFGFSIPGLQWWIVVPSFFLSFFALAFFIWGTIDYFNDWVVVTNRRVVHQEKVLFVNEWRKEAPLEQIQNVSFNATFIGRWLNYGTMVIQTASTSGVISFDYTTHFEQLKSVIYAQREQRRRHSDAQSKLAIHRMLEARLGQSMILPSQVLRGEQVVASGATWRERRGGGALLPSENDDRIVWRRHWLVLIPKLWWSLLILAFWLTVVIVPLFFNWQGFETLRNAVEIVGVLLTMVALIRIAWVVANWHNDTYEVTDDEIAHVEKLPLSLTESRKSAGLGRLQNVEMEIPTPWHWFFNYGNVKCQTAAEMGDFIFDSVSDPRAVAEEIQLRMERFRRREENNAARKRAQELPDWFEVYRTLDREAA